MGQLWDMWEAYLERNKPLKMSNRGAAEQIGMSPTAFGNWKHGLVGIPERRNLLAFADLIGASYSRVVDAALADARYLPEDAARKAERESPELRESLKRIKRARAVDRSSSDTA